MKHPPRIAVQMELSWGYDWHTGIYEGIQCYADERGWELSLDEFVARHGDSGARDDFPYDAVIGRIDSRLAELTDRWRIPTVNVWYASPARQSLPTVSLDPTAVGHMAAEHLLHRGYRRFALLSRHDNTHRAAANAFDDTVRQAGGECLIAAVDQEFDREADRYPLAMRTVSDWINAWQTPIGVLTLGTALGRFVVQMCTRHGVRVPQDAAIVCANDAECFCLRPRPTITQVIGGYEQIGRAAAQLLDEMLQQSPGNGGPSLPPRQILMPPVQIVSRESTDFCAIDDQVVAEAIAFIRSNAHRDIGQQDVARAVASSARTLQVRFSQVLERPIAATIRLIRIENARRELTQSERTIAAIARDSGFGTIGRMNRAFQAELGMTATAYRRQWKGSGATD